MTPYNRVADLMQEAEEETHEVRRDRWISQLDRELKESYAALQIAERIYILAQRRWMQIHRRKIALQHKVMFMRLRGGR